jgi:hypothetical protein
VNAETIHLKIYWLSFQISHLPFNCFLFHTKIVLYTTVTSSVLLNSILKQCGPG